MFQNFASSELNWLPEIGIGYYPVKEAPYDKKYFERYQAMKNTEIGLALNKARVDLVAKYTDKDVLDIGIGSGAFVESIDNAKGFDINPFAVEWLVENHRFKHPLRGANSMTFWDSLEHIHDPREYLNNAKEYVFISCPIFKDCEHLLGSKHKRYDEHCWYFTEEGLIIFMWAFGFKCLEVNAMETEIGREDIKTFVFKRV